MQIQRHLPFPVQETSVKAPLTYKSPFTFYSKPNSNLGPSSLEFNSFPKLIDIEWSQKPINLRSPPPQQMPKMDTPQIILDPTDEETPDVVEVAKEEVDNKNQEHSGDRNKD